MATTSLHGLDLLATAIMLVDDAWVVRYMNPAAENLFGLSSRNAEGEGIAALFGGSDVLVQALCYARDNNATYSEHDLSLGANGHGVLHLSATVTPIGLEDGAAASFL